MLDALRNLLTHWFGPSKESGISRSAVEIDEVHAEIPEPVDSHPVPYDETLLERARTQWQFGEWESLAQINRDTLQHHPDRAKLALLAAAGRLQTDKIDEARQYVRLAKDWGVSKKFLTRILAAGVHNSLGRAAAIAGEQTRALQHFHSAIATGSPGSEARLLVHARISQQYQQLGLPPVANGIVSSGLPQVMASETNFDSKKIFTHEQN